MLDSTSAPTSQVIGGPWPSLPADSWPATRATLHMWTQIVGKVRMALSPPQNHFWHTTLYVSPRGLTTSAIPAGNANFQLDFDFVDHRLQIQTSWSPPRALALESRSVADFYAELMSELRALGIQVSIWTRPVEIPDPIPFDEDREHASYDPAAAHAFWRTLVRADHVFKRFRGRFLGKSSPVHFFWGGFDLAVTRFSGRRAPMWDGPVVNVHPHVMHASYSHEVSSAGFWPGDATAGSIFYSYAVPTPAGYAQAAAGPSAAAFSDAMGEFVLPYASIQSLDHADDVLGEFLQATYAAAADLGGWDRALLEESPTCMCDVEGRRRPRFG